jgi:FixJ family two-component response regulator
VASADIPTVFVIDDDAGIRASIQGLLKSAGLRSESFETAEEFLYRKPPDSLSCLILDVNLPGISGLDFQQQLSNAGLHIPIIFVTGYGDIPMTVKAMKSGAVEFLTKLSNAMPCWKPFTKLWLAIPYVARKRRRLQFCKSTTAC